MAGRVQVFDVTATAETEPSEPQITDTSFQTGEVEQIQVIIPDGAAGLVGLRVLNANGQVVPYGQDTWIRGNDEVITWPLEGYASSGSWQLQTYNEDIYAHTIQVRYLVREPGGTAGEPKRVQPVEVVAFQPA